jgi:hypothetical protein
MARAVLSEAAAVVIGSGSGGTPGATGAGVARFERAVLRGFFAAGVVSPAAGVSAFERELRLAILDLLSSTGGSSTNNDVAGRHFRRSSAQVEHRHARLR